MNYLRRILIVPLAVAVVIFVAAGCGSGSDEVPSSAVAVVGEQTVTKTELDRLLNQARANSRSGKRPFPKPETPTFAQIRSQIVQFLVRRAQFAQAADERGIEISDDEVDERRSQLVQQYFGGDEKEYEKRLKTNGVTDEQTRVDIKASLIQQALIDDVGKDVRVSDAELRKYYRVNEQKYGTRPYKEVKAQVREELLERKRNEASSKYVERVARSETVKYQHGFAPRQ